MNSRIEQYAEILVHYSIDVKSGDKVVIESSVTSLPLVREIYRQILLSGAHPLPLLMDDACVDLVYQIAGNSHLDFLWEITMERIRAADKWISIDGGDNTKSLTQIDPSKIARAMKAQKPIDDLWTERTCAYGQPNFLPHVIAQFPCQSAAQDAEMSLAQYEDFVYGAAKINVDCCDPILAWVDEEEKQKWLVRELSKIRTFRFTTATGTDVKFRVDDTRKWWTCAGRENFPDGEVYTTPLENSANGVINFQFPTVYNGVEVDGVTLQFRDGKVILASATKNEQYLYAMLKLPGATRLGELAFGVNDDIQRFTKNILFDEKIGGTFHIALGDAYPNTGGTNESQVHWDMIEDLRHGGKVYGDGKLIQENGKWLFRG